MAEIIYGPPMAKNMYVPLMAKNTYKDFKTKMYKNFENPGNKTKVKPRRASLPLCLSLKILFTTHLITNFSLCAKHRKGTVLRSGAEQIPPEQPQPQQQPLYHQPPVQPVPPQGENLYQFYYFYLKAG